jgi:hypothetical protein
MLVRVPAAVSLRGLGVMVCPDPNDEFSCYDDGSTAGASQSDTQAALQDALNQLDQQQSKNQSGGVDLNAIANITAASAKAINAAQGPYVVPGTNAIYNPATGQLMSSAGLSLASGVTPSVASAAGSIMMPVLVLGVLALFIFGRK